MTKPLTKEEIVRKLSDGWVGGMTPGDEERIVYPAMDIWAKGCLMGFQKWCDGCTFHWEIGNPDFKDWHNLSPEQVIDKYIFYLNQSKQ